MPWWSAFFNLQEGGEKKKQNVIPMKARVSAYLGNLLSFPSTSNRSPQPSSYTPAKEGIRGQKDRADSGVNHFPRSGSAEGQQPRSEVKGGGSGPKREMLRKGMVSREDWRQKLADVVQDPAQVTKLCPLLFPSGRLSLITVGN